jgi:hypothetical protein
MIPHPCRLHKDMCASARDDLPGVRGMRGARVGQGVQAIWFAAILPHFLVPYICRTICMSTKLHTCHMLFPCRKKGQRMVYYGFLNIKSGLRFCCLMLLCLFVKVMVRFIWWASGCDYILLQLLIKKSFGKVCLHGRLSCVMFLRRQTITSSQG